MHSWSRLRKRAAPALAALLLAGGASCGRIVITAVVEPDPARDAGIDGGYDAGYDAGIDAGYDAGTDAGYDAGTDAGYDAGTDAGLPGGCPPRAATGSSALAYQIDPGHSGGQPGDSLTLPLCERWSRDLGATVSYPVVEGGRVFVTLGGTGASTSALVALDQQTGRTLWGPVELGGFYPRANATAEGDRVFASNTSGLLRAFDAATGTQKWSTQMPGQYFFSSPPTARDGLVYLGGAGGGGTVYAVDEKDGRVVWTGPVANGDQSTPAVGDREVYVSYACNQAYGFDRATGALRWHSSGPCEGGGGKTVALAGGAVYTRDYYGNLILDAADGHQKGTYASRPIPAFDALRAFITADTRISAQLLADGATAWSFGSSAAPIDLAPIVVGAQVVTGSSSGQLYVLDAATGALLSTRVLAGLAAPDEQNVSAPLTGLAAADGMLFVPAGPRLVAY